MAGVRYAYGEGTTRCAAPHYHVRKVGGLATRRAGFRERGKRPCCPVPGTEFPAILPLPACRTDAVVSVGFVKWNGAGIRFPPFHYFLARPRSFARAWPPKAGRGARGRAGVGHKERPAGPTNLAAAAGRHGRQAGPVGRTAKERGLFRSGGKGRATGRGGPFHCRRQRSGGRQYC